MFHCTRGKGEVIECRNYNLLSVVGEINEGILVDRLRKVTEGWIDDKQVGFRSERGCVAQTFTVKQIDEKA